MVVWYYNSPNQTGPALREWNIATSATSTSTSTVYYDDAGWELGTGGVTSATTVISPRWIRPLAWTEPYDRLPRSPQRMVPPPAPNIQAPAILRRRRQIHETQEDYDTRRLREDQTREQLVAARVEQMAAADRETRLRRERMEQAQLRARELLLEHLTPEQRDTFVANGWFVVEGKRQRYRIETHRGYSGNVVAVARRGPDDALGQRYCAHCDPGVAPGHDQFLAQKFMLEHAEDDFLRIANRH